MLRRATSLFAGGGSYATSRSGQTYLFLFQQQQSRFSPSSVNSSPLTSQQQQQRSQQQEEYLAMTSADATEDEREHLVTLQRFLFRRGEEEAHHRQQGFDDDSAQHEQSDTTLSHKLTRLLAQCSNESRSSISHDSAWSRAFVLLSEALKANAAAAAAAQGDVTAKKLPRGTTEQSSSSSSIITKNSFDNHQLQEPKQRQQQTVVIVPERPTTLHFNLALAIASRCEAWSAMQRCEAAMAVNDIVADAHTLNIFMDASCASGDWSNALELFTGAVVDDEHDAFMKQLLLVSQQEQKQQAESSSSPLPTMGPLFNSQSVRLALRAATQPQRIDTAHWRAALKVYSRFPRTIDRDAEMLSMLVRCAVTRAESDKPLLKTWEHRWRGKASPDAATLLALSAAAERSDSWEIAVELAHGAVAVSAPPTTVSKLASAALRSACRAKQDAAALGLFRRLHSSAAVADVIHLEPNALSAVGVSCARLGKLQDLLRVKEYALQTIGFAPSGVYTALLRLLESRYAFFVQQQQQHDEAEEQQRQQQPSLQQPDDTIAQQREVLREYLDHSSEAAATSSQHADSVASDSVTWMCLQAYRQQRQQPTTWEAALVRLATATRQPDAMVFAVAVEIAAQNNAADAAVNVLEAAAARVVMGATAGDSNKNSNSVLNQRKRNGSIPFAASVASTLELILQQQDSELASLQLPRAVQLAVEFGFDGTVLRNALSQLHARFFSSSSSATQSLSAAVTVIPLLAKIEQFRCDSSEEDQQQQQEAEHQFVSEIVRSLSELKTSTASSSSSSASRRLVLSFLLRRIATAWTDVSRRRTLEFLLLDQPAPVSSEQLTSSDLAWLDASLATDSDLAAYCNVVRIAHRWGVAASPLYRVDETIVSPLLKELLRRQDKQPMTTMKNKDNYRDTWRTALDFFHTILPKSSSEHDPALVIAVARCCALAGDTDTAARLICDKRRAPPLNPDLVVQALCDVDHPALVAKVVDFFGVEWPKRTRHRLLQNQWSVVHQLGRRNESKNRDETTSPSSLSAVSTATAATTMQLFMSHLRAGPETITAQSLISVVRSLAKGSDNNNNSNHVMANAKLTEILACVQATDVTGKLTGRAALAIALEWRDDDNRTTLTTSAVLNQLLQQAVLEGLQVSDRLWRGAAAAWLVRVSRRVVQSSFATSSVESIAQHRRELSAALTLFQRVNPRVDFASSSSTSSSFPETAIRTALEGIQSELQNGDASTSTAAEKVEEDLVCVALAVVCLQEQQQPDKQHQCAVTTANDDVDASSSDDMMMNSGDPLGVASFFFPSQGRRQTTSDSSSPTTTIAHFRHCAVMWLLSPDIELAIARLFQQLNSPEQTTSFILTRLFCSIFAVVPSVDDATSNVVRIMSLLLQSPGSNLSADLAIFAFGTASSSSSNTSNVVTKQWISDATFISQLADLLQHRHSSVPIALEQRVVCTILVQCCECDDQDQKQQQQQQQQQPSTELAVARMKLLQACAAFCQRSSLESAFDALLHVPLSFVQSKEEKTSPLLFDTDTAAWIADRRPSILRAATARSSAAETVVAASVAAMMYRNSNASTNNSRHNRTLGILLLEDALSLCDRIACRRSQLPASTATTADLLRELHAATLLHLEQLLCWLDVAKQNARTSGGNNTRKGRGSNNSAAATLNVDSDGDKTFVSSVMRVLHERAVSISKLFEVDGGQDARATRLATRLIDLLQSSLFLATVSAENNSNSNVSISAIQVAFARLLLLNGKDSSIAGTTKRAALIAAIPSALLVQQAPKKPAVLRRHAGRSATLSSIDDEAAAAAAEIRGITAALVSWSLTNSNDESSSSSSLATQQLSVATIAAAIQNAGAGNNGNLTSLADALCACATTKTATGAISLAEATQLLQVSIRLLGHANVAKTIFTSIAAALNQEKQQQQIAESRRVFQTALHTFLVSNERAKQQHRPLLLEAFRLKQQPGRRSPPPPVITTPLLRSLVRTATALGCVEQLIEIGDALRTMQNSLQWIEASDAVKRLLRGIAMFHVPMAIARNLVRDEERLLTMCRQRIFAGHCDWLGVNSSSSSIAFGVFVVLVSAMRSIIVDSNNNNHSSNRNSALPQRFDDESAAPYLLAFSQSVTTSSSSLFPQIDKQVWICLEGPAPVIFKSSKQQQQQPQQQEQKQEQQQTQHQSQQTQTQQSQQHHQNRDIVSWQQVLREITNHAQVSQRYTDPKRTGWGKLVLRCGGTEQLQLVFQNQAPWHEASRVLSQVLVSASHRRDSAQHQAQQISREQFVLTVASAHLQNVAASNSHEATATTKIRQARVISELLVRELQRQQVNSSPLLHRLPALGSELMAILAQDNNISNSNGACCWSRCFEVYSAVTATSNKHNKTNLHIVVPMLSSMLAAVQNSFGGNSNNNGERRQQMMMEIAQEYSRSAKLLNESSKRRFVSVATASAMDVKALDVVMVASSSSSNS